MIASSVVVSVIVKMAVFLKQWFFYLSSFTDVLCFRAS